MLSNEEKSQVKNWLSESFQAAQDFDGSEASEERLFASLSLFDEFVRTQAADDKSEISELERQVSEMAFPDHPVDMPLTVDGFLDTASGFYDRLTDTEIETDVYELIENAGGVVKQSDRVFVKTDEGQLKAAEADDVNQYKVRTEPRLEMLVSHLRNDGVNGQSVYMDDLVITQGQVDDNMMREHPYNIVQIPRLDAEVAVCDQIGEATFVKKGNVGSEFWDHMSKNDLKERDDITAVNRRSDQQWWGDISEFLSGHTKPDAEKVKVKAWNRSPAPLDKQLAMQTLQEHYEQTGSFLSKTATESPEHSKGSYVLKHGAYADGDLKVSGLENRLKKIGSSIAKLHGEIAEENPDFPYKNSRIQPKINKDIAKDALDHYRVSTGNWFQTTKHEGDTFDGGPLDGMRFSTFLDILSKGRYGIDKHTTVEQLHKEIAKEKGLSFKGKSSDIDLEMAKETLRLHRIHEARWLHANEAEDGGTAGSYVLRHGSYKGMSMHELRYGVEKNGETISSLNEEVSEENDLDYINRLNKGDLDIELVRESLLAHYNETGEWLSASKKNLEASDRPYMLEYGPYADQESANAIDLALGRGTRGLGGGSSIAKENKYLQRTIVQESSPTLEL